MAKTKAKISKKVKRATNSPSDSVEQYVHSDKKRPYDPPVGLVTPETDGSPTKTKYAYDQHLDPQLQWAGKAEHTSFEVDTVSLHVHERIDPMTIIEGIMKKQDIYRHHSLLGLSRRSRTLPCVMPSSFTSTVRTGQTD